MKKIIRLFSVLLIVLSVHAAFAQPAQTIVNVVVAPDHSDWVYKPGEKVKFTITVLEHGNVVKDARIRYEIGPEKMDATIKDSMSLATGTVTIDGGTMKTAGFLRCTAIARVGGKEYRKTATAGFDPATIQPTIEMPADFTQFWETARTQLATIPMDAKMTLLPERCTEKVNVYHVSLQNFRAGSRLYGILCVPKKEGKYPALLRVPGAGVRPYYGDVATAEKGIITFTIGIHGISVIMDVSVYNELGSGALRGYQSFFLDNPDLFYYKRVYMGCLRANDFITSLPQFDGTNLAVTGGSQGGALSIVTAALDSRVKYLAAFHPALCDVTGYLKGRAGGWPHYFDKNSIATNNTKEKLRTCGYYDVVNFARILKTPGLYSWGYNDDVCPPTSMYAAYNVINAPKQLLLALEKAHWYYPEQVEKMDGWLVEKLTGR